MSIRHHINLVEIMLEAADNRRLLDKLTDFIAHDETPENERRAAVGRFAAIASLTQKEAADLMKLVAPTAEDRRQVLARFRQAIREPAASAADNNFVKFASAAEINFAKAAYGRYADRPRAK